MNERPISVGELLRREGHQGESHDSQARRALGGVAVGAVLAFGAVVGGLVLHNAGATPSDMPVAGGGSAGGAGFNGSVPVASTGTIGSGSGSGGGLLGAVGSTLGSVTQPVFNWFGGN